MVSLAVNNPDVGSILAARPSSVAERVVAQRTRGLVHFKTDKDRVTDCVDYCHSVRVPRRVIDLAVGWVIAPAPQVGAHGYRPRLAAVDHGQNRVVAAAVHLALRSDQQIPGTVADRYDAHHAVAGAVYDRRRAARVVGSVHAVGHRIVADTHRLHPSHPDGTYDGVGCAVYHCDFIGAGLSRVDAVQNGIVTYSRGRRQRTQCCDNAV